MWGSGFILILEKKINRPRTGFGPGTPHRDTQKAMRIFSGFFVFAVKKACFIFFVFGLWPAGLWAQEDRVLFLPSEAVFDRLIGDPREPQNYLAAELDKDRFDGSIAATLEFLQWIQKNNTRWGWGIEGDTFIQVESPGYGQYSLTDSNYYLVLPERVSDWYLGTYLSESSGDFSNRLEFLHVSSQLGDGFFKTIQGFPYTQESFRFTASYQPSDRFRLYAGVGCYTQTVPEVAPFFAHAGVELYSS